MKKTLLILSAVIALSACTSNGSVSNYAIGDDSAAIKAGRNRAEAQLSRAELEQHRRQRTNVSEELALERENVLTNMMQFAKAWAPLPEV